MLLGNKAYVVLYSDKETNKWGIVTRSDILKAVMLNLDLDVWK